LPSILDRPFAWLPARHFVEHHWLCKTVMFLNLPRNCLVHPQNSITSLCTHVFVWRLVFAVVALLLRLLPAVVAYLAVASVGQPAGLAEELEVVEAVGLATVLGFVAQLLLLLERLGLPAVLELAVADVAVALFACSAFAVDSFVPGCFLLENFASQFVA